VPFPEIDIKQIENTAAALRDHFIKRLRARIEGGHRRGDDRPVFGGQCHIADMAGMQGRFTGHQNQTAPFLEHHIGGTGDQIVCDSACHLGQGLHRAGCDDHAACAERSRCNRCTDIRIVMDDVCHLFDIADFKIGFIGDCALCRLRKDQVSFDWRIFQQL